MPPMARFKEAPKKEGKAKTVWALVGGGLAALVLSLVLGINSSSGRSGFEQGFDKSFRRSNGSRERIQRRSGREILRLRLGEVPEDQVDGQSGCRLCGGVAVRPVCRGAFAPASFMLAAIVGDADRGGGVRRQARLIGATDGDGVNAAVALATPFGAQFDVMRIEHLPVG